MQTSSHPFPAKSDVVLDELLKPIEHPDPVLEKQFQEIIGQLVYCQQQIVPEILGGRYLF